MNPVLLYIDPGTGSMLFAILIGIFGAAVYVFKTWLVKIKFFISSGKAEVSDDAFPLCIFSDDKRYWNVFEPVCAELARRNISVKYLTASPDDPALSCTYDNFSPEFIGEGNKAFAKLNFLKARILLSTTPGLDVYQWKRSKDVKYYLHMLHACDGVTAYRMFGLDYYDGVLLSGKYQENDLRALEHLRNLKEKEIEYIGIPYMDKMKDRINTASSDNSKLNNDGKIILLAPSWGPSSILNKYGAKFIQSLIDTGYHIIVRPHPQSFSSEKDLMDRLMSQFPVSDKFEWNRDNDNFNVLNKADVLISDFSAVTYDFALVYDKPIIYADTEFDKSPYDAWWLDTPFWTFTALPRIGMKLSEENLENVKDMIDEVLFDPKYADGRDEVRCETWCHPGEGAVRAADFIERKLKELSEKKEKDIAEKE